MPASRLRSPPRPARRRRCYQGGKAGEGAYGRRKAGNGGAKAPTGAKAKILDMIARKNGASAAEVCKELGWVKAGATIGRAIKLASFKVRKERDADGVLRYYRAEG